MGNDHRSPYKQTTCFPQHRTNSTAAFGGWWFSAYKKFSQPNQLTNPCRNQFIGLPVFETVLADKEWMESSTSCSSWKKRLRRIDASCRMTEGYWSIGTWLNKWKRSHCLRSSHSTTSASFVAMAYGSCVTWIIWLWFVICDLWSVIDGPLAVDTDRNFKCDQTFFR